MTPEPSQPDSDRLEFEKYRLVRDLQDELLNWGKSRLIYVGLVVTVVGFFGLSTVVGKSVEMMVQKPVSEAIAEAKEERKTLEAEVKAAQKQGLELAFATSEASNASVRALQAVGDAMSATAEATAASEQARKRITDFDEQFKESEERVNKVRNVADGATLELEYVADRIFGFTRAQANRRTLIESDLVRNLDMLARLERLLIEVAEESNSIKMQQAIIAYDRDKKSAQERYNAEVKRIEMRRALDVHIYLVAGKNSREHKLNDQFADALTADGYQVMTWLTENKETSPAIVEVADEVSLDPTAFSASEPVLLHNEANKDVVDGINTAFGSIFGKPLKITPLQVAANVKQSGNTGRNTVVLFNPVSVQ